MAELHLVSLKCVKKQQTLGKDRVNIFLNGVLHSGPHLLGKGDEIALGGREPFTGSVEIKLEEDDNGGKNEVLGTRVVRDSEGDGTHEAFFNARPGADYHIKYHVHEPS